MTKLTNNIFYYFLLKIFNLFRSNKFETELTNDKCFKCRQTGHSAGACHVQIYKSVCK